MPGILSRIASFFVPRRSPAASASSDDKWSRTSEWWQPMSGGLLSKKAAGEIVSHDSAQQVSTYHACLSGIAEDLAAMPRSAIRRLPMGREVLDGHWLTTMLHDEPNPDMSAFTYVETMQSWCDGWGNAYSEIQRTSDQSAVVALWPIHPSRVAVKRDASGSLYYWVRVDDESPGTSWVRMEPNRVFHLHGIGNGLEGDSVLAHRAESLGLALAAQSFASKMFENDLMQRMIFTPATAMDPEPFAKMLEGLSRMYAGTKNAGGIFAHNGAGKFDRWDSINPDEAQALESRQFSVPDICRWFRRSPSKVGYTQQAKGWATREDEQADDVQQCLLPRIARWENEIRRKLLRLEPGITFKFFVNGLMRGNSAARAAYIKERILTGTMTPNEARTYEDENVSSDAGADLLWMQSQMKPVEQLSKEPVPPPPPATTTMTTDPQSDPVEVEPEEPEDDADSADEDLSDGAGMSERLRPVFLAAASKVIAKECATLSRKVEHRKAFDAAAFYAKQRGFVASEFRAGAWALGDVAAVAALDTFAAALWPDPVARMGEALRSHEADLSESLADGALSACAGAGGGAP